MPYSSNSAESDAAAPIPVEATLDQQVPDDVDRRFPHVAEIHLTVVDRAAHGTGVGTAMLSAIECDAVRRGVRLLEVKTLGPSDPDPGYARTRHFYEKFGFLPLEETALWGAGTPCLIMVKPL